MSFIERIKSLLWRRRMKVGEKDAIQTGDEKELLPAVGRQPRPTKDRQQQVAKAEKKKRRDIRKKIKKHRKRRRKEK